MNIIVTLIDYSDVTPKLIEQTERYAKALGPSVHRLIRIATRVQGLIVRQGNPADIRQPADLARPGLRFVNRQRDSGTRLLLDQLLQAAGIDPAGSR